MLKNTQTRPIGQFQHVKKMKENFDERKTLLMFAQKAKYDIENALIASYKVLKLIVKCGKAHTNGKQLILPAATEIMSIVFKMNTN